MAAKRITKSAIDWAKFAQLVPEVERPMFIQFKSRSDSYLRSMMTNPEAPPAIDWSYYRTNIVTPGVVDALEKAYKGLKVPYPKDTLSQAVDAQQKADENSVVEFCATSELKIKDALELKSKFEKMIPYVDMTQEDFTLTFPDWSVRWQDPSVFPHEEKTPGLTKEERAQLAKPDGPPHSLV